MSSKAWELIRTERADNSYVVIRKEQILAANKEKVIGMLSSLADVWERDRESQDVLSIEVRTKSNGQKYFGGESVFSDSGKSQTNVLLNCLLCHIGELTLDICVRVYVEVDEEKYFNDYHIEYIARPIKLAHC